MRGVFYSLRSIVNRPIRRFPLNNLEASGKQKKPSLARAGFLLVLVTASDWTEVDPSGRQD